MKHWKIQFIENASLEFCEKIKKNFFGFSRKNVKQVRL